MTNAAFETPNADVLIETVADETRVAITGDAVITVVEHIAPRLVPVAAAGNVVVDLSRTERLDTAGAWLLLDLEARVAAKGGKLRIDGASPVQSELIEAVRKSMTVSQPEPVPEQGLGDALEIIGRATVKNARSVLDMLAFLGAVVANIVQVLLRPWRLRTTSLVHHMQEIGYNAIPIVSLMAFLIGVVLAFQGAAQLRQFGAEVFVVDLISISILRELGILLTAIIVAGRTGSAITAAIGSMKMREEIDAMRTLGLDPIEVLVVPRVLALVIMLPILGFIADIMGLVGGALMSWIELGVSPGMFQTRLVETVDVWHYLVGLIKAPFFAVVIGVVGSYEGMRVEGNAESLGRCTSKSVVLAIFTVIVVDAMFSIFFAIVDV